MLSDLHVNSCADILLIVGHLTHPHLTLGGLVYAAVAMTLLLQSSSSFRVKRCEEVLNDPVLKSTMNMKLLSDFTRLTEKLIELTEKPIGAVSFDHFLFKNSFIYRYSLYGLQFPVKYAYRMC
jgi:hypothetical protein